MNCSLTSGHTLASPRSVLVADDSSSVRRALSLALAPNYQVMIAGSGSEAIRVCEEEHPDVALVDLVMPETDGFDVLNAICRGDCPPKVIFLTAVNDCRKAVSAMKLGASDYLVKPCSADRIRQTIDRVVG